MEKITHTDLIELNKKLGSHKYEIIDISTEWCTPCKKMRKSLTRILNHKKFKDEDVHVYVLDGDDLSDLSDKIKLVKEIKRETDFPIKESELIKFLRERFDNSYSKRELREIVDNYCNGVIFEKNGSMIKLKDFDKFENIFNPYEEFDVSGYPTLIFFKDGRPIQKPLDETDYYSRGFVEYDPKYHKNVKPTEILEIEHEGKIYKIFQINKTFDARIVGFENMSSLFKLISKFLSM